MKTVAYHHREIEDFIMHYKKLEPNKWTKIKGFKETDEAKKEIIKSIERYKTE